MSDRSDRDRIRLDDLTDNQLDALYDQRDSARRMLDPADLRLVDEMLSTVDEYRTRAEQAERDAARFHAAWHSARLRAQREASHSRVCRISRNGWRRRAKQDEAAIVRVRALATQWAVLRNHGSAATELRAALDGPHTT
ncbi:hypothetical protein ACF07T_32875 [Streptomyces sp. NPDC015184]|uniref:hypothetical protein n=1 Tax=Streptomyces sp. NPDC015184 TaxID=3364946 RepID=UPI0036FE2E8A